MYKVYMNQNQSTCTTSSVGNEIVDQSTSYVLA